LSTPQKVSWIDAVAVFALPSVPVTGLLDAGQFKIQFSGYTNVGYDVLASTNLSLALSNWAWLGLATPLSNNVHQFVDVAMSNDPCRFYQVRLR
jgi:hypothetical protein